MFLNTVPLEDVIVSEIASCPAAPVAPCLATLYCVAVPPLVYVNTVLVHRYCPADTDGGVDCHPLEGADVFDEDAAYVMSAFEIPLPVLYAGLATILFQTPWIYLFHSQVLVPKWDVSDD